MLTQRQSTILANLINAYIRTAEPVASADLARLGKIRFSAPTVRNELQELDELGYVFQPHTSAGRIPTNKGYRYFIDELIEPEELERHIARKIREIIVQRRLDTQEMFSSLLETICRLTHSFGFVEQTDTDDLYTFGFSEVAKQPEFRDQENIVNLAKVIDRLRQQINNFEKSISDQEYRVFIGSDHPLLEDTTSVVVSQTKIRTGEPILFGFLGPTRMNYPLEIALMKEIRNLLQE